MLNNELYEEEIYQMIIVISKEYYSFSKLLKNQEIHSKIGASIIEPNNEIQAHYQIFRIIVKEN